MFPLLILNVCEDHFSTVNLSSRVFYVFRERLFAPDDGRLFVCIGMTGPAFRLATPQACYAVSVPPDRVRHVAGPSATLRKAIFDDNTIRPVTITGNLG
jgi:hypothetical protein